MTEYFINENSLPEAYHKALLTLYTAGDLVECPDYNTTQKEISITFCVAEPFSEPMISRLMIGGPEDLQQYCMEMVDGILDFEVSKGNWNYTYHDRMINYPVDNQIKFPNTISINQLDFVVDELKRNPYSRRAVIDIRDNSEDTYSDDPACLQHLQFFIRDNRLHLKVLFRSNDACKATFMNAFALIMLQKSMADRLGIEIGSYTHRANSFHCYKKDFPLLKGYVARIIQNDDVTFEYENDWLPIMKEAESKINKKVKQLKDSV